MEQPTWIGRSLNGRYKIDALLGQGGMSAVYKAIDPNLKRVVAIKLIHPHLSAEDDFIYRFKREAAAVAALRHQNIIQVYDFNTDNDVHYMVLEFVPGETLQDRLKHLKSSNTKMPLDQAAKIIINVCDALTYAHKLGMIHRDIKPANIMLNVHGDAILMDFGIVKLLDDTTHTATGAVVGTARYMSPEVIRSEVPDERSDLYSLGVTFYEMLSGDPPFDAPSAMSLLMRHLNDPVPDLSTKRQDIPPELIHIVNKTLEKDRDNRYRSARELAGDLRRFLATLETDSVPTAIPAPKIDSATAAETKKSAGKSPVHTEDQTEPWEVSTPAPKPVFAEATQIDEPVKPSQMDKTAPDMIEAPKQEIRKAEIKNEAKPASPSAASPLLKYGVIGAVILIIVISGMALLNNRSSLSASDIASTAGAETVNAGLTASPLEVAQQTVDAGLTAFSAQPASTFTKEPTATTEPTATLEPTATNTLPPLYVRINNITVNAGTYVVDYETFGYTEVLPGQHIHFFFNTVSVEQAGSPGTGPWELYGGPRPFTKYGVSKKPAAATQMCALVANANHSIIPESGNCFDLPE